jgi:hypothetical protein
LKPLKLKDQANLETAFYSLRGDYKQYNIRVMQIRSDHESNIWSCRDFLANKGIKLRQVTPYQHAQRIERYVRTIKTRMRSVLASLPYELPKNLYGELLLAVVFGLNDMPTANFPTASRRMILEGKRYDFADRCQIPFGTLITADFAGKEQDSYLPRSEAGVALGPSNDRTEKGIRCYVWTRKFVTTRSQFKWLKTYPEDFPWRIETNAGRDHTQHE